MAHLFDPLTIGTLSLANRIVVAPMCQYSASNGCPTDWHLMHLGTMSISGAGLLILEATAVSPTGRITSFDLGLYSDACETALGRTLRAVRAMAPTPIAVQLSHAGRKASTTTPWTGGRQVEPTHSDGWATVAPSAIRHSDNHALPTALDDRGMAEIRDAFAEAARRAARLGLDGIELHGAHGYLIHQFLSPLSNTRTDRYGGSLENRMRFPLELFETVRAAVPASMPVWVRVSASDWSDGGWTPADTVVFAGELDRRGCSAIHVSSGGLTSSQQIAVGPGYQVAFAEQVKAAVDCPVIAVGLITDPAQADAIIATGQADAVALARAMLFDPRWPWHAAAALGAHVHAPNPYLRSQPRAYPDLFR